LAFLHVQRCQERFRLVGVEQWDGDECRHMPVLLSQVDF
jgi:hypothetical protein